MDITDILNNLDSELLNIYNKSSEKNEKDIHIKELEEENNKIKEAATKLIADFDKVNNRLKELVEENTELKEKVVRLQRNYVDTTSMGRQNTAYGKAFGAILGAIEACKKEL